MKILSFMFKKGIYFKMPWFVFYGAPWIVRGAHFYHGLDAGLFSFYNTFGQINVSVSFRVDILCQRKENINSRILNLK